jgi:hypothetical protein
MTHDFCGGFSVALHVLMLKQRQWFVTHIQAISYVFALNIK